MQVLLRTDMTNLGKRGDVCDVADGYARNYLLPKGLAITATKGMASQAAAMRRARDVKDARDREAAELVARALVPATLHIPAKAGPGGKLFGSVTTAEIAQAAKEQTGVALDRRHIHLEEPIKTIGSHEVPVKLHADVEFRITIDVAAE